MSTQLPSEESPLLGASSSCSSHDATRYLSKSIAFRVSAAMYSFAIMGLFQSSVGAMLEPISEHYSLSDLKVSFIFVVGPIGYVIAARFNNLIHRTWGRRGIAVIATTLQTLGAFCTAAHPPFGVALMGFAAVAMGGGLLDGSWCTWAASRSNANTVSGMLQGAFSVGAAAGPVLARTVLPTWTKSWYDWYYVLAVASAIDVCFLTFAFRHDYASEYLDEMKAEAKSTGDESDSKTLLKSLSIWLSSLYFLMYVGSEASISGWVVPYMSRYRNAAPELASLASSGYWAGMAFGRFVLGIVTDKLTVNRANMIYFLMAMVFQVAFTLVHVPTASIILMTLVGIFMGPMFPSGVVIITRLLPAKLHIAAVSFTASIGQVGAALLPFGIGALIQGIGIGVFGPIMVIWTSLGLVSWIQLSRHQLNTPSPSLDDSEVGDSSEPLLQ